MNTSERNAHTLYRYALEDIASRLDTLAICDAAPVEDSLALQSLADSLREMSSHREHTKNTD